MAIRVLGKRFPDRFRLMRERKHRAREYVRSLPGKSGQWNGWEPDLVNVLARSNFATLLGFGGLMPTEVLST